MLLVLALLRTFLVTATARVIVGCKSNVDSKTMLALLPSRCCSANRMRPFLSNAIEEERYGNDEDLDPKCRDAVTVLPQEL